eukprot:CAMPEP_0184483702 /NCGR_PEP_ID=MMETSP0113_2-20130426/5379_1 /TAXON_ID=91329 /ORGANISM="Norrisiella sphaerica, Strain BC52" /LENGTH=1909 /DNA_ID=CAMNT_0026864265 /DNA_START=458 /DNA_END=6184 /DNA_ORIENTATION=+
MPRRPSRLVEYFVTIGISQDSPPLPKDDRCPITSLMVITEKDDPPEGWEMLTYTVSGESASVTGTGMFYTKTFICFERDPKGIPISDLQVRVGNEAKPMGYIQLPQNLNKGGIGKDIFLCYTHAYHLGHDRHSVVDIVMIAPKAGEKCPSDYMLVNKNLNAGSFRDPLYLCVKKISDSAFDMRYKPVVLDRFPYYDLRDSSFPDMLPIFCYPQGADVVVGENPPLPKCTTFILTMVSGMKLYGICINFHEIMRKDTVERMKEIAKKSAQRRLSGGDGRSHAKAAESLEIEMSDEELEDAQWLDPELATANLQTAISSALEQNLQVWLPKTLCIVTHWPFYDTFTSYLVELWRLTLGHAKLPPERYLSNLWETPLPKNSRVNVQLSIANTRVVFDRPPADTLPLADYNFSAVFRCLSVENIIEVLCAIYAERKILLVTAHSSLLTPVAEALLSFIFPFQWQYAYIPVLPTAVLGLDLLSAPMPVFVGITATHVDPKILASGEVVFVNLDYDVVRVFGKPLTPLPQSLAKTLTSELKNEANIDSLPPFSRDAKDRENIGSEFLFKQLPSNDVSPDKMFKPLAARACFLHLNVSLLHHTKYRTCLKFPHVSTSTLKRDFGVDDVFDVEKFVSFFPRTSQAFVRMLTRTQAFARFSDEKTLISSDRQSELDFFDQCCNYEAKFRKALTPRRRNRLDVAASGVPTLLQHLSETSQECLLYEVPPPDTSGLPDGPFAYPEGFPFLDEDLFYPPRPVDERYMKNVTHERRSHILADFKSAFLRQAVSQNTQSHGSGNRLQRPSKQEKKLSSDDIKLWRTAIYSSWFQVQATRMTGKNREMWTDTERLSKSVDSVFKTFDDIADTLFVPVKGKKKKLSSRAQNEVESIYKSLLSLCGEHKEAKRASVIFEDMKQRGVETTGVTYVAYLHALASRNSKRLHNMNKTLSSSMGSRRSLRHRRDKTHMTATTGGTLISRERLPPGAGLTPLSGDPAVMEGAHNKPGSAEKDGNGDLGARPQAKILKETEDKDGGPHSDIEAKDFPVLDRHFTFGESPRTKRSQLIQRGPSTRQKKGRGSRRASMLPTHFSARLNAERGRNMTTDISKALYQRDLDRKLRRRRPSQKSTRDPGATQRGSASTTATVNTRYNGSVGGNGNNVASSADQNSKAPKLHVGSYEEGFEVMQIARTKSVQHARDKPRKLSKSATVDIPGPQRTRDLESPVSPLLGTYARDSPASAIREDAVQNRIDWTSLEIGVGPGQMQGFGDGAENEFDVTSPLADKAAVDWPSVLEPPKNANVNFSSRPKEEREVVLSLCSLSTAEIMAGWPLDSDIYKSRHVRDSNLSFVPRIAVMYSTFPYRRKRNLCESPLGKLTDVQLPAHSAPVESQLKPLASSDKGDTQRLGTSLNQKIRSAGKDTAVSGTGNNLSLVSESNKKFAPTPPRSPPPEHLIRRLQREGKLKLNLSDIQGRGIRPVERGTVGNGLGASEQAGPQRKPSGLALSLIQHDEMKKEREHPNSNSKDDADRKKTASKDFDDGWEPSPDGAPQSHLVCVPFLTPRELSTEISKAVKFCPQDFYTPYTFREVHLVLYWNLFWYSRALKLPLDFLLGTDSPALSIKPVKKAVWVEKLILPASHPSRASTPEAPIEQAPSFLAKAEPQSPREGGALGNSARLLVADETGDDGFASSSTKSATSPTLPDPKTPPSGITGHQTPAGPSPRRSGERQTSDFKNVPEEPRFSNSASLRRGSMARLRQKVLSAPADEQVEAAERAENARRELGRIYLGIVQSLTRRKIAAAMEAFLDARMFVQSNLDYMYTCMLKDQNELMLAIDWRGSMFIGLLQIVLGLDRVKAVFGSVEDFTDAFEKVDQSFFRKDKRELIQFQDQVPPRSVFEIYSAFNLADFYDKNDREHGESDSKKK